VITIDSSTAERVPVTIATSADPTGGDVEFSLTTGASPTVWVAGTWDGSWNATTGRVSALSPLVGDGQDLDTDTDGVSDWSLWVRWTVGTEVPVRLATKIRVT